MAKDVWDRIKDLFKTESQKAQDRQDEINRALEDEKSILDELKALDEEYKNSLPEEEEVNIEQLFPSELGLEEVEYTPESDEDLTARAQRENALKKQGESNRVEHNYETKKSAYEGNRQKAEESLKEGYDNLEKLYDELRRSTENDMLKRGLARSSIASEQLANLDTAKLDGAGKLRASYNSAIADIEGRISELEADKSVALEELDIKYALELDERIEELKKERDKTAKSYNDYNNKVKKQNADYALNRQKKVNDYLSDVEERKEEERKRQEEYEKKYGYSGEKQDNYARRFEIAREFYTALDPEIAADALAASPNMKYYLGVYYDRLLNALKSTRVDTKSERTRYF